MIGLWMSALLAAAPAAPSAEVPDGVVLAPAPVAIETKAREKLQALLTAADSAPLAAALNDAPRGGRMPMMLGTFTTLEVKKSAGFDATQLRSGNGKVPITSDVPMDFAIVGANTAAQRDYLAQRLRKVLPAGAPRTIRAPNFDELALVWFYIGWDLDAPLLVAEWDAQRVLFDFDPAGEKIDWIERLDRPCFTLQIEQKNGLECYCLGIERRERQWTAIYVPAEKFSSSNHCET